MLKTVCSKPNLKAKTNLSSENSAANPATGTIKGLGSDFSEPV